MVQSNSFVILFLLASASVTVVTLAHPVEVKVSTLPAKLPLAIYSHACAYDGADSVYVLGGRGLWERNNQIFRFNISTETVETLGNFTSTSVFSGASYTSDGAGSLYMFGGEPTRNQIRKYVLGGLEITEETNFTVPVFGSAAIWDDVSGSAFIFGGGVSSNGYTTGITQYFPGNKTVVAQGRLPTPMTIGSPSAVWDGGEKNAYIFGGGTPASVADIKKYRPSTNTSNNVARFLPEAVYSSAAFWDPETRKAYIFGGDRYWGDDSLSDAIVSFDPETEEVRTLGSRLPMPLINTALVYLPHLRRSYIFGGWTTGGETDTIVRIDIDELVQPEPTTEDPQATTEPAPTSATEDPEAPYRISRSRTTLPQGHRGMTAAYDGEDSVYLMGGSRWVCTWAGCYYESNDQIWRFTPSSEKLDLVGRFNDAQSVGRALWDAAGRRVLFFGGRHPTYGSATSTSIWSFVPDWRNVSYVGEVPVRVSGATLTHDGGDKAYLFGGNALIGYNSMLEYTISTESALMGPPIPRRTDRSSSFWNQREGCAYILGGWESTDITKYCPATGSYTRLPETLPERVYHGSLAWDGVHYAYIIGGRIGNGGPISTIVRYEPGTASVDTLPVQLPFRLDEAASVWIPGLKRVYVFGGYFADTRDSGDSDQIIKIDVNV